jgi:hypothetical protein
VAQATTIRKDSFALAHKPEQSGDGPGSELNQEYPTTELPGETLNQRSFHHPVPPSLYIRAGYLDRRVIGLFLVQVAGRE